MRLLTESHFYFILLPYIRYLYMESKELKHCFLVYNYFKMSKIFDSENFNYNHSKALIFIQKILGNNHLINIKMIRLGYNTNYKSIKNIQPNFKKKLKY